MVTDLQARLRKRADQIGVLLYDPPKSHPDAVLLREAADRLDAKDARIQELEVGLRTARGPFETIAECAANCIHSPGQATNRSLAQYGIAGIDAALNGGDGK